MHINRLSAVSVALFLPSFLTATLRASNENSVPKLPLVSKISDVQSPVAQVAHIRVNEVMPLFSLPQDGGIKGSLWNLRDQIGQSAFLMIVATSQSSRQKAALALMRQAMDEAADSLRLKGFETFLIIPTPSNHSQSTISSFKTHTLIDMQGALHKSLDSPTEDTILLVDRAGFVRRLEPLTSALSSGAAGSGRNDKLSAFLEKVVDPTPAIAVGQPAPNFTIRDMSGRIQRLSDYRNRQNLLLTFFPKCFTGGCRSHLSSLRDDAPQITATDTTILAVSVDPAAGPRGQLAFAKDLKLPFPLVPDVGRNLSILYGAANSPEQLAARISVLIDKAGIVLWIDKQIDVKTHGKDVLSKLHELHLDTPRDQSSKSVVPR